MSTATEYTTSHGEPAPAIRHDTLAASVVVLLVFSCVQPLVTFLRGFLFCRWLEPADLGCWDMALSFVTLLAPVAVLGIPGSFGRYVERYSRQGQLGVFLRRTALACLLLGISAVAAVTLLTPWCSYIIFGRDDLQHLVHLVALCLATMIAFGFVVELLTALRMFRVVSLMQFVKGIVFALLGAALILNWVNGPESLVLAYALACLTAVVVSAAWMIPLWRSLSDRAPATHEPSVPAGAFWSKLMPFAVWVWLTNILSNLFEIADRYMIVHFGDIPADEALALVGHYHSSRVIPLLFVTFTAMLASVMLPHLARDWEAGRRTIVSDGMVLALKLCAMALTAGATCVLLFAPWIFEVGFHGKYDGGLAVLPWTLTYCAWFGMIALAEMYLWCAERARLGSFALLAGLIVNIFLNLLLLPYLGLLGAVLATAASKLLVLFLIYASGHAFGLRRDPRMWALTLLPLSLCLGALPTFCIMAVVGLATLTTRLVLSLEEKQLLATVSAPWRDRIIRGCSAIGA